MVRPELVPKEMDLPEGDSDDLCDVDFDGMTSGYVASTETIRQAEKVKGRHTR